MGKYSVQPKKKVRPVKLTRPMVQQNRERNLKLWFMRFMGMTA